MKAIYVFRYLLPFIAPYYLLLAFGLSNIRHLWPKGLALGFSLAIALLGVRQDSQTSIQSDWRTASAYVLSRLQPGDITIFNPPWYRRPFDYYAKGRVSIFETSEPFVPERLCREVPDGLGRLWLIQPSSRQWSNPSDGLMGCLDKRFVRILSVEFPPNRGTIVLYDLRNK